MDVKTLHAIHLTKSGRRLHNGQSSIWAGSITVRAARRILREYVAASDKGTTLLSKVWTWEGGMGFARRKVWKCAARVALHAHMIVGCTEITRSELKIWASVLGVAWRNIDGDD